MMAHAKRVLLVDDDNEVTEAMRVILEIKGYETQIAKDGNQALAMAEQRQPDLMVIEIAIPKRSGFSLLEKFQSRSIPAIVATSIQGLRHQQHAATLGVDDYFRKPFSIDQLLAAVERQLN